MHVERFVDMFKEWEAYDTIVCAFVLCKCGAAELGFLVICAVNSGRVEDLVDAVMSYYEVSMGTIAVLTTASHHWVAKRPP